MKTPEENIDPAKQVLINKFRNNVKGKKPDVSDKNANHDGKEGHWLEQQFGVPANANNKADIYGYELKNETRSKTTFEIGLLMKLYTRLPPQRIFLPVKINQKNRIHF